MERLRAEGRWTAPFVTRLSDRRGHALEVDLTREEGGGDRGTSSLELLVLSTAGCISTIFALVARRRRLEYAALDIELEADRPPKSPTITAIRGQVTVRTRAPAAEVETAVRLTVRTCPVGVILERAGIPVDVAVTVLSPEPDPPAAPAAVGAAA